MLRWMKVDPRFAEIDAESSNRTAGSVTGLS
jgi:hypothetical protein